MFVSRKFAAVAALGLALSAQSAAAEEFITIGTAGQTGIYYVVGQSVCQLVNRNSADHDFRCTAAATGGSIANLNGIREGDFNFGVVQSDWQFHAVNGSSAFEEYGPNEKLRAVFSAHPDVVTVVARADSEIRTLDDLPGHRVNIGNPGSGSRATAEVLLSTKGIDPDEFSLTSELKSNEQSAALCDNKIDAMMFSAGHPVGNITEATVSCDTVFLQIDGPEIDKLVDETPYYEKAQIPAGMYKGQDEDINSYGPLATFVTSTDTSDEAVYQVVKAIFENFDRFKKLHPAFAHLQEQDMVTKGNIAPLHEGAIRYYRERGWM
ncbi:TAXI family TRAP transporter solute-binding subunit [Paracoccus seriniphilus]|uniref:TAXI family TRAP transporter solute-binding subunit n=1 Tax=Paracoccus seriniphilus TaxID=184748 RepID=UPI003564D66F